MRLLTCMQFVAASVAELAGRDGFYVILRSVARDLIVGPRRCDRILQQPSFTLS